MKRVAAYLLVVFIAAFGAWRAEQAQERAGQAQATARAVDLNGDRSLCKSENKIRAKSNARDASLEDTAKLVKEALLVISKANRIANDDNTNAKLRSIARRAHRIRTNFETEKLSDCESRFPREAE